MVQSLGRSLSEMGILVGGDYRNLRGSGGIAQLGSVRGRVLFLGWKRYPGPQRLPLVDTTYCGDESVFAAFCAYPHSCPFSWLVFCEAVGVMISERYEGAVFHTYPALANIHDIQEKDDHGHFPPHDGNRSSLVFPLQCLFFPSILLFLPPSAYRMRTCRLKSDLKDSNEEALTIDLQARTFDRRNLIVDLRV